jgi:hypothetical protein
MSTPASRSQVEKLRLGLAHRRPTLGALDREGLRHPSNRQRRIQIHIVEVQTR